jgi:hypothetical protein
MFCDYVMNLIVCDLLYSFVLKSISLEHSRLIVAAEDEDMVNSFFKELGAAVCQSVGMQIGSLFVSRTAASIDMLCVDCCLSPTERHHDQQPFLPFVVSINGEDVVCLR